MNKVHVYTCLHFASIKSTAGNNTSFFPSPFLISACPFLILAEAFRNDYIAACSIALHNATEKNELGGYVTVPVHPKWHSVVSGWIGLIFSDVTRLVTTEHIRNQFSLSKSRSVVIAVIVTANLLTLSILI